MPQVVVYSTAFCGHCTRAIALLEKKGVAVTVIDATFDPDKREEMKTKTGCCTFPQIFIGEAHVGGCSDLQALDAAGELDPMLERA